MGHYKEGTHRCRSSRPLRRPRSHTSLRLPGGTLRSKPSELALGDTGPFPLCNRL